jgi:hypothetical protein
MLNSGGEQSRRSAITANGTGDIQATRPPESRARAIFKPSRRAFYRELLGIRVRVNLLGTLCVRYNAAQQPGGDPLS